jgi:List-Bact-rpt repeat protein
MNGPITENASFTQNPVQVTVQTNPAGRTFTVDGTTYSSTQTFSWQPASSHTIATTSPQSGDPGVQNVWTNWSDRGTISHTVAPTTNKTYTANFTTQYYLTMTSGTGGTVSPASGWKNSGVALSISARPANSYHFANWTGSGTGSYSGTNNPASITMGGPITEAATFTHN